MPGRKLYPRDVKDVRDIVLHHDDGVVILDLYGTDPSLAAWAEVVKQHMLLYPGRSFLFVDGTGLLVSGQRRVWHDLYDKLSARARVRRIHTDPVLFAEPTPLRTEQVS